LAVNAFLVRRQQDERESGSRELMMPRGNTRPGEDRMPQNPACNGWLQAGFLLCLGARREGVPKTNSTATQSRHIQQGTGREYAGRRRVFTGERPRFPWFSPGNVLCL